MTGKTDKKVRPIVGGSYRMPNKFTDVVMQVLESLRPSLWPTFEYIWRMSYGFNRTWAPVSVRSVARAIGKSWRHAHRSLDKLQELGVIERRERAIRIGREKMIVVASYEYRIAPDLTNQLLIPFPTDLRQAPFRLPEKLLDAYDEKMGKANKRGHRAEMDTATPMTPVS